MSVKEWIHVFWFQSKEDLTEWGWKTVLRRMLRAPAPSAERALALAGPRMRMALNNSSSASSNTWECGQWGSRQRARCALLVYSHHHHTPRHLRHLPAVSPRDNSRGYPRGYTVTGRNLKPSFRGEFWACLHPTLLTHVCSLYECLLSKNLYVRLAILVSEWNVLKFCVEI